MIGVAVGVLLRDLLVLDLMRHDHVDRQVAELAVDAALRARAGTVFRDGTVLDLQADARDRALGLK